MQHTYLVIKDEEDNLVGYPLRLTVQDLIDIERVIGRNPLIIFNEFPLPKLNEVMYVLYFAINHYQTISLNDLYVLMDTYFTFTETIEFTIKLYKDMGVFNDKPKKEQSDQKESKSMDSNSSPQTIEEQIVNLYDSFIEAGLSIENFWNKTLKELHGEINIHRSASRERANFDYIQSSLIAARVGELFSDKKSSINDKLEISKVYPNLFDKKTVLDEKTAESKNNLMKWVEAFNRKKALEKAQNEIEEKEK